MFAFIGVCSHNKRDKSIKRDRKQSSFKNIKKGAGTFLGKSALGSFQKKENRII